MDNIVHLYGSIIIESFSFVNIYQGYSHSNWKFSDFNNEIPVKK